MGEQLYRARRPRASPLWRCLQRHFDGFLECYEHRFQKHYGYLRPIITEVVEKFLECGDLSRGFARIRCEHCKQDHLLAFSCKGRWFCPSCHQKKVQLFGSLIAGTILYPVPHRHLTLGLPKMLRPYFRYNRDLLKELCRIAQQCITDYLRTSMGLPEGIPGVVMAIHTFGEYLDFHPHLHALVADGLFRREEGRFHILPEASLQPLEELFRARVIAFLVKEGLLPPQRARMLLGWRHSGFNVYASERVEADRHDDLERLAQYIIRNPFSVDKMHLHPAPRTEGQESIIYRSRMNKKVRGNFQVFTPCEFIAAITQHIPDKSFQLVRYYGWYSNKMRGRRARTAHTGDGSEAEEDQSTIDIAEHQPRRIPSRKWRELIKKVWEADPLLCPRCGEEMRIVALIDETTVIERILRHLGLWQKGVRVDSGRGPPPPITETIIEPYHDDPFPDYDNEPVFC